MNFFSKTSFIIIFTALTGLCGISAGAAEEDAKVTNQVLIRNVSIWDGTSDESVAGQSVLIEGNLIKSIGDNLPAEATTTIIDGHGRLLWHYRYHRMNFARKIKVTWQPCPCKLRKKYSCTAGRPCGIWAVPHRDWLGPLMRGLQ
ncbi:MAG: hypothetical protein CL797_08255 [Chromatiales bacterium]|jgi:hypothetical protein|nr:hypothetical protein [Chromatiales bacterium]